MKGADGLALFTIFASHYCEKARWALDLSGLRYEEVAHVPMFHWGPVRRAGGKKTVPCLRTPEAVLTESSLIVAYAATRGADLLPKEACLVAEVGAWEARLDADLGPAVRRIAYHHLLPHRDRILEVMHGPSHERAALRVMFPVWRALLRRGLAIDAASVQRSQARIDEVVAVVDAALLDGRRYLVADRFTSADLTLAALLAPLVLPPEHPVFGGKTVPPAYDAYLAGFSDRPAFAHVRRMYAKHRAVDMPGERASHQ